MKLLSVSHQQWLLRHSKRSHVAKIRSGRKRRLIRASITPWGVGEGFKLVSLYRNGRYDYARLTGEAVPVPTDLSLHTNYEETAEFLERLRKGITSTWQPMSRMQRRLRRRAPLEIKSYWDFTLIERVSSGVALIIASEYDRIRRLGGWVPRAIDFEKWSPPVKRMLDGIGFLDLVGIHNDMSSIVAGDGWKILRFKSGLIADGAQISSLLESMGAADVVENPKLYEAIVEALVNTRHHAYPPDVTFAEPHFPGWWITGFVDERDRRLQISVYDQGMSIPGTLHSWGKYSAFVRGWRRLFRAEPDPNDTSRDGTAVALAMAVGRSSTGEEYRGRGLPAMEAAIDLCRSGHISIYSRCGVYRRSKGGKPQHFNRNHSVGGTLIVWSLSF